ncbi:hypothetical protein A0U92_13850 [Acetobacter aceti]|uniref:Uncharacterized protein n=1 Tax=Acetobacter aceti TaxID=435 RepID=A0A1U9KIN9_ACEAC|nr:hypothetical protein A0U92_13850 [Acetobacter aceti]
MTVVRGHKVSDRPGFRGTTGDHVGWRFFCRRFFVGNYPQTIHKEPCAAQRRKVLDLREHFAGFGQKVLHIGLSCVAGDDRMLRDP